MSDLLLLDATDFLLLEAGVDFLILGTTPVGTGQQPKGGGSRRQRQIQRDDDEVMQIVRKIMEVLDP